MDPSSPEVSAPKVFVIQRTDGPEMALPVWTATGFDEAVVQRKVVANAVSPASSFVSEVWVVSKNIVVNVTQNEFFFWRA